MIGKAKAIAVLMVLGIFVFAPSAMAAKRCTAEGKKVKCPTQTKKALEKAADSFEEEAVNFAAGKGGATYGLQPFDYLTGVGKATDISEKGTKTNMKTFQGTESGYAKGTGKTEVWNRKEASKGKSADYNQWANNWSPTAKNTLIPGTNPNEGKQWYYVYCVGCHGWTLRGNGPNAVYLDPYPRNLTVGKKYMNKKTNVELFSVIKGGGAAVDLSDAMPAWGNLLQDQDIWNLIAWIRANADTPQLRSSTDLERYLNPKSSFDWRSKANAVTPKNAADDDDFQDALEMIEAGLAGRGVIASDSAYVGGGLRGETLDIKK